VNDAGAQRRWPACQEIPAVVREIPDEAAIAMALIENIQRENLNPLEEARALDRLIREFDLTHAEAAEAVGRSRAAVSNLLRLQELSDKVKPMLEARQLEMGHARALLAISNAVQQLDAARQVVARGLTVRQTEARVRKRKAPEQPNKPEPHPDPGLEQLAGELSRRFSVPVSISRNARGNGKITIAYNGEAELDAILKTLK